jgi:PAS domain S-box-containing protein
VNKAGAELFGVTEPKIAHGINIRHFLSPDNIEQMQRGLSVVMSGAKSPGEIYSLKQLDGNLMRAIVYTSLIHREGRVIGFRGVVLDISERIRLEEALTESEEYLQSLIWSIRAGIFVIDAKTHTIIDVNPAALDMMGTTKDVVINHLCHNVICPVEVGKCPITDLNQTMDNAERTLLTPDGREISIIKYVVPVMLHGKPCLLETFIDNSYRKQIELNLAESEEKYRALTENTPDILFSTDMAGIITYVSPAVNKYGFLVEEVTGKTLRMLIHPADIDPVESNLSRELEKCAQFVSQFRILDKWGTTYWFEEKSFLRLDISGKPVGIYGILRDVTERKRVEDAIDIANKKLNLMNQITRHDILNSITGLLGCVDTAKATTSPEENEELLNDISDLTRVIQRHITFTREYQEVGVHLPQWQHINDLLNTVLQNFEKTGIIFSSELEKMEIYADPLLEKVFYNLVENAIRYGVTLTTISIYPCISDKGLSLVFEDDGVGVDVGQKREIFKRGVGKNTGMGLFLTAEILAITGITIEENGIFKKGARFEIRIPNGTWRFPRD